MAPEYAIHGSISLKLDVFSFGVLVLEIVSARRNNSFYDPGNVMNLLSYVSNYEIHIYIFYYDISLEMTTAYSNRLLPGMAMLDQ